MTGRLQQSSPKQNAWRKLSLSVVALVFEPLVGWGVGGQGSGPDPPGARQGGPESVEVPVPLQSRKQMVEREVVKN